MPRWWRKDKQPAQAQLTPEAQRPRLPRPYSQEWINYLEPGDISALADQVMWARETILWMLHQVAAHRWDGHDCPVYCLPATLEHYLTQCGPADLRILISTVIKDSVHMGAYADYEDVDDES